MTQASDIVADLERLYNASVDRLKAALNRYINDGTPPNPEDRTDGSFAYPELRLKHTENRSSTIFHGYRQSEVSLQLRKNF